jgi:hypothetical protein
VNFVVWYRPVRREDIDEKVFRRVMKYQMRQNCITLDGST